MIERKIGEIFFAEGKKLRCVEGFGCLGCCFSSPLVCFCFKPFEVGYCNAFFRTDKQDVKFIEIP